ncbi:glycoside hydrolase family 88 protein [Ruminococcaceae bacterium OttesenSCG-928-A16]|nr:glycoside hydrolase family 88 protein [Ruminococcaceae bacterium OttesenSCG-928-A16]
MEHIAEITTQQLQTAVADILAVLKPTMPKFTHAFRDSNSRHNFYPATPNVEWTTGFCTGTYWLAYEATGDALYKDAALVQVDSFLQRIQNHVDVDHHDMGFLYSPSCVAAYKLTGNQTGHKAALLAADNLMARFQEKGQFFQAWGTLGAKDNYRLIIDCLLNLPLLYWASEQTGNPAYAQKADAHTKTSLAHLVRQDYSTYHTYFFNPETGEGTEGITAQGYRNGSAWARGQAWGVYGLALSYRYTKNPECIDLFYKVTDFFVDHLPKDGIPYWDLDFTDGDGEPKDSSAAAIAACGMLEMAKYLPADKAAHYTSLAKQLAASLATGYAVKSPEVSDGLLLHGVYAKKSPYNTVTNRGVDECNTWGDYFWFELLTRLSKNWELYW